LRRDRTSPRFETSLTAIWPFRSAGLMPAFFLRYEFAERPVRQRKSRTCRMRLTYDNRPLRHA
jgi:hypothetical protein